jgi:hypothetical protein
MKILSLCLVVALLQACALENEKPFDPVLSVPASFLAKYPRGSQQRAMASMRLEASKYWISIAKLYDGSQRHNGGLCFAVAIRPDGSVHGVELLSSSMEDPEFENALTDLMTRINFGPAAGGTGDYDLDIPFDFRSSRGRMRVNYCASVA